jgi:hypothetical protein
MLGFNMTLPDLPQDAEPRHSTAPLQVAGDAAAMNEKPQDTDAELRAAEVSMVTTEHFALQSARSATIAESTGRANVFLGAVSGGLVALGLVASASGFGSAFAAFGLVVLPTLSFLGLVTFERVLRSGVEDQFYGRRIAQLRSYYFDRSPRLARYLFSVPPEGRLQMQALHGGRTQDLLTVAGMVAVITSVLAGSAVALVAATISSRSLFYALVFGVPAGVASLAVLMRAQHRTWSRARGEVMFVEEVPEGATEVHWHARAGTNGPTLGPPSLPRSRDER